MNGSATDLEKSPTDEVISSLKTVISSVDATSKSIDTLLNSSDLANLGKGSPGISLLGLKADTIASYVHNLGLRLLFALAQVAGDEIANEPHMQTGEEGGMDSKQMDTAIRKLLVTDRVILERGVRPLERKIEYQIQKLLRTAASARTQHIKSTLLADEDASERDNSSDDDERPGSERVESAGDDEEDDVLPLSYKPRPSQLVASTPPESSSKSSPSMKKYVPPKINPTKLPSTKNLVGPAAAKQTKRMQRNQALEEYLEETTSTAPEAAPSVGANVLGHGRGGTRTKRAQANEDRVRGYEEENFLRLQDQGKKKRKQNRQDEFMGENWSLDAGDIYGAVKRKKRSVWDRNK
ncbi:hypothetical protein V1517DRAFT_315322 [Lipomyces orientalis]|uniref:Uncharacterized protein n=1 Tax=Lipomyces orientalis TaxID=1233043 RepID=A0ACC3TVJ7_9ASCO